MLWRTTFLFALSLTIFVIDATPRERTRVKYRIKTDQQGKRVVDKAVAEVVDIPLEASEAINGVEGSSLPIQPQVVETIDLVSVPEEASSYLEDPVAQRRIDNLQTKTENNNHSQEFQGIQRAARFNERSIGDIVFDVAKEVVAEVVGGALTRIFGIGTAREGGSNMMEIILGAISRAGKPKSC